MPHVIAERAGEGLTRTFAAFVLATALFAVLVGTANGQLNGTVTFSEQPEGTVEPGSSFMVSFGYAGGGVPSAGIIVVNGTSVESNGAVITLDSGVTVTLSQSGGTYTATIATPADFQGDLEISAQVVTENPEFNGSTETPITVTVGTPEEPTGTPEEPTDTPTGTPDDGTPTDTPDGGTPITDTPDGGTPPTDGGEAGGDTAGTGEDVSATGDTETPVVLPATGSGGLADDSGRGDTLAIILGVLALAGLAGGATLLVRRR